MRPAWGEAAWTARELNVAYLLTDAYGALYGRESGLEFETEADAVVLREELGALGIECWVITIERGSLREEEYTC